jgi:hypothetical protein
VSIFVLSTTQNVEIFSKPFPKTTTNVGKYIGVGVIKFKGDNM